MMFLTENDRIIGVYYSDTLNATNYSDELEKACNEYDVTTENAEEGYALYPVGQLGDEAIIRYLDECISWDVEGVKELMQEMCERKDVDFDKYDDYDSLFDRLSETKISLDNGHTYQNAHNAMPEIKECGLWDAVVNSMNDDIREKVHAELAPCTEEEFLQRYLELADEDLVIG